MDLKTTQEVNKSNIFAPVVWVVNGFSLFLFIHYILRNNVLQWKVTKVFAELFVDTTGDIYYTDGYWYKCVCVCVCVDKYH